MTGRRTPPTAAWWLGMLDVCLCARVCVRVGEVRMRLWEPGTSSQRVLQTYWRVWTSACDSEKDLTHLSRQSLQKVSQGPQDPVKGPWVLPLCHLLSPIVCNVYGNSLFPCCYHEVLSFLKEESCLFITVPQHPAQGRCVRP